MNLPWNIWERLSRCTEERDTLAARVAELERELEQAKADLARAAMDARNPLMAQLAELEARIKRLETAGDELEDCLYVDPPNCSCHIRPPCDDCVNNWGIREAKENWKQTKESKP